MPRRGGLPRRCGFEGLQARNADGLQAYGNGARLTGMIDASLKIICYGRGVPNYFANFAASLIFLSVMTKFVFRNFREGYHAPTEDQIVLHAICNLLGKEYVPIKQGVTPLAISSRICLLLKEYGIHKNPTWDFGTCSHLLQDLIDHLSGSGILPIQRIEAECLKVADEYPQDCIPPMNLSLRAY